MNFSNIFKDIINQNSLTNQDSNNNFMTKLSMRGIGGVIINPQPQQDDLDSNLTQINLIQFVYPDKVLYNRPNISLFISRPRLKLAGSLSGKITAGSVAIGSTKGIASSSRMLRSCTQMSGDIQFCASQIIPAAPVVQPEVLFNTSSFDRYNIPEKYKKGLLTAVQRWSKFIKYNPETIKLIKQHLNNNNWSGLELTGFELVTTGDFYAETESFTAKDYTALYSSFTLKIRDNEINRLNFSQSDIDELLTHELGHALGFTMLHDGPIPLPTITQNAQENGNELFPNILPMIGFSKSSSDNSTAVGLHIQYFTNAVKAYRQYGGNRKYSDGDYNTRMTTSLMIPVMQDLTGGLHLSSLPIFSERKFGNTQTPLYVKLGINNDVMTTGYVANKKYFISEISIGVLLDLYTNLNGKNYPTYIRKGNNSEVGSIIVIDNIMYFGK